MDYHNRSLGLSGLSNGKKTLFLFCVILLGSNLVPPAKAVLTEEQSKIDPKTEVTTDVGKSNITKRQEPEAQRREHAVNPDGTINYNGSGSGHDSGDLIPPSDGFSSKIFGSGPGPRYGPPSDSYGVPKFGFGSSKPSSFYGPPSRPSFRPPKNGYLPPAPGPQYGPPSGVGAFSPLPPKPVYGPPSFGPPAPPKGTYGVPKPGFSSKPSFGSRPRPVYGPPNFSSGTPLTSVGSIQSHFRPPKPSSSYGTPLLPSSSYGTPDSPSPPEIKFDGWKPIPGLVSKPPSGSYGPPSHTGGDGGSFFGTSSTGSGGFHSSSHSFGSSHSHSTGFGGTSFSSSGPGISFGSPSKPSSSYGTPLAPSISYGPPGGFRGGSSSKGHFFGSISSSGPGFSKGPTGSFSFKPPKPHGGFSKPPGPFFGSHKRPSSSYGPPKPFHGPPKIPSSSYGPPSFSSSGPSFGPPRPPSFSYGPPRPPSRPHKPPSSSYGPPKPPSSYGPPTGPSGFFGPPKPPSSSYGPPTGSSGSFSHLKPPSSSYGVPHGSSGSFGHSKPSSSYGVPTGPTGPSSNFISSKPAIFTNYKIPKPGPSVSTPPSTAYRGPPVPHPLQPPAIGTSTILEGLYNKPLPPTALYGVPEVTLSPITAVGCCGSPPGDSGLQGLTNSYGVPLSDIQGPVLPPTSYAPTSPAISVPYQAYGVPLPSLPVENAQHSNAHGNSDPSIPPTVLPLPQPKKPVKFRPPVPEGLISSIGAKWSSSGAWGGQSQSHHHHHHHQGPAYIPPAVPDPDPGVRANKDNPTIIPPPTAPPVQYGPPPSSSTFQEVHNHEVHHQASNQLDPSFIRSNNIEGDLNPPPPTPPEQQNYQIQSSIPLDLPVSNPSTAIDNSQNFHPPPSSTNFNSNVDSGHYQASESYSSTSTGHQNFNSGVQTIPIKGSQGSYTLQIQAAGGNSDQKIPHAEVLSNGLLQDILAAIENPAESAKLSQYSANSQSSDPIANEIGMSVLQQLGGALTQEPSISHELPTQYGKDLAHASSNNLPEYSQPEQTGEESAIYTTITETEDSNSQSSNQSGKVSEYLNKNNIAFYYNNQPDVQERNADEKDVVLVQTLPNNGTQFGSEKTDFGSYNTVNLKNAQKYDSDNSTATTNILENSSRLQLNRDSLS